MNGETPRQIVRSALSDSCAEVQAVAIYGAGLWRDAKAVPSLRLLLEGGAPSVARSAAEALGRIGDAGAIGALLQKTSNDRFVFHSFAYALYEIGDATRIADEARGSTGASAEVSKTALAMLALPTGTSVPALPLVTPTTLTVDAEGKQKQLARLHELLGLLKNGSAERGAELFKSGRALCSTCHAVFQSGGVLGPDLTKVGAIRTATDLLEAIVYPSNSFVRSYEPFHVRLHSGKEYYGIVRDETQAGLRLATGPSTEEQIKRSDIASITEGAMSLMPPGFDGLLTPSELADMVAYLLTLR
jgi:putative heme-binding domain-containing protein